MGRGGLAHAQTQRRCHRRNIEAVAGVDKCSGRGIRQGLEASNGLMRGSQDTGGVDCKISIEVCY